VGWHTIQPASRIREGTLVPFKIAGRFIAVGRDSDGLFAIDDTCPHAGASLAEGLLTDGCVVCPIHGYAYHVRTGEGMDDGEELAVHPVEVDGDVLRVLLAD